VGRNKYALEKEKRKWWIWGLEKIQMQMVDEEWKKNGKTTSLPPDESFTFIVHEEDCLRTFED
jgi:hypothetical protein